MRVLSIAEFVGGCVLVTGLIVAVVSYRVGGSVFVAGVTLRRLVFAAVFSWVGVRLLQHPNPAHVGEAFLAFLAVLFLVVIAIGGVYSTATELRDLPDASDEVSGHEPPSAPRSKNARKNRG